MQNSRCIYSLLIGARHQLVTGDCEKAAPFRPPRTSDFRFLTSGLMLYRVVFLSYRHSWSVYLRFSLLISSLSTASLFALAVASTLSPSNCRLSISSTPPSWTGKNDESRECYAYPGGADRLSAPVNRRKKKTALEVSIIHEVNHTRD